MTSALQRSEATSDPEPGSDIATAVGAPATTAPRISFLRLSSAKFRYMWATISVTPKLPNGMRL